MKKNITNNLKRHIKNAFGKLLEKFIYPVDALVEAGLCNIRAALRCPAAGLQSMEVA